MTPTEPLMADRTRRAITRVFRLFEDVIFVGLGLLLAGCALYLLVAASGRFFHHLIHLSLTVANVVELIENLLLILLVVEILYTVQVSFREHTLAPEPFLLIGLIAAVRRVLVITVLSLALVAFRGDCCRIGIRRGVGFDTAILGTVGVPILTVVLDGRPRFFPLLISIGPRSTPLLFNPGTVVAFTGDARRGRPILVLPP